MEITNNKLEISKKQLIAFGFIVFLLSVITSQILLLIIYKPWLNYNPEETSPFVVEGKIKTILWNGTIDWIEIPLIDFFIETNEETRIHRHNYIFLNEKMGLERYLTSDNTSTTFAAVYLVFNIEKNGYDQFLNSEVIWRIETTKKTITSFELSKDAGNQYIGEADITGLVNKLSNMPQRVEATLILYNR